jgi:excisionase family DNA binding protein
MDTMIKWPDTGNGIMTVHDVAEYLRLSEAKVYRMANDRQVPALRMGKAWRFKKELIDEWIRRETEESFYSTANMEE